ncbi:MAG: TIGR01777 family protein [Cytophagales bacterium]|nr:MAG: TIGR01777 family protein [Cytophagales bacterium]
MKKNILITGGSGTVGQALTKILQNSGYQVSHLSRSRKKNSSIKNYYWNIDQFEIEAEAILDNDIIVHLAGAGVFDSRWTESYRKEILESRIRSTALLFESIRKSGKKLDAFVSASAIGIYGSATSSEWYSEESLPTDGFLADVVKQWENEVDKIIEYSERIVKIRIGIVMSKTGGALEQLSMPIRYGIGAKLGHGNQWVPWIHIQDLCNIFQSAISNPNYTGTYNAASPFPITNNELTREIAKTLNRPLILPFVPAFVLELILGKEKASFVLEGSRVSPNKLMKAGYQFQFANIQDALKSLLL